MSSCEAQCHLCGKKGKVYNQEYEIITLPVSKETVIACEMCRRQGAEPIYWFMNNYSSWEDIPKELKGECVYYRGQYRSINQILEEKNRNNNQQPIN